MIREEDSLSRLKQLTLALSSPDEELNALFSSSQNLLCLIHENDRLVRVSDSWCRTLGWSPEELTSQSFFNFIHPDDIEKTREAWEGRTKQGEPVHNFTNRYRCRNGSYRTFLWNTPGMTAEGTVYTSATDITELVMHG